MIIIGIKYQPIWIIKSYIFQSFIILDLYSTVIGNKDIKIAIIEQQIIIANIDTFWCLYKILCNIFLEKIIKKIYSKGQNFIQTNPLLFNTSQINWERKQEKITKNILPIFLLSLISPILLI